MKNLLRPLNKEEETLLHESIKKHGLITPIIVTKAGEIIDGWHRQKIATELCIPLPATIFEGSEASAKALAIELNAARRQLSKEDRDKLIRQLYDEGHAQKKIAGIVGLDQSRVSQIVKAEGMNYSYPVMAGTNNYLLRKVAQAKNCVNQTEIKLMNYENLPEHRRFLEELLVMEKNHVNQLRRFLKDAV